MKKMRKSEIIIVEYSLWLATMDQHSSWWTFQAAKVARTGIIAESSVEYRDASHGARVTPYIARRSPRFSQSCR